jgi:L-amino acid N-acyltransferase YncA
MGLYPRYDAVAADGRGAWFSARTEDGRVVGLATARLQAGCACRVDGFAHALHSSAWGELTKAAVAWATAEGASTCYAEVATDDEEKIALLEASGFRDAGRGEGFDFARAHLRSRRLEIDI